MSQDEEEFPGSYNIDAGPPSTDHSEDIGFDEDHVVERSLLDDLEALVADARTYFDAEISFQKSRAAYVGETVKHVAIAGIAAAIVAFVALIALAVGLIIALTPLITAWGATALVTLALLIVVALLLRSAGKRWKAMSRALSEEDAVDD